MKALLPIHLKRLLKSLICIAAVLPCLLLSAIVFAAEQPGDVPPPEADASLEPDVSPWSTHTMLPGETYDVSTASKNTTVYIDSAGNYYLKGESTYCRIVIRSGGVNLYLKDGLVIDPGIYAYVGSSTAAITVEDQGGTVRLISEKNAQIYFGGYYYAPAIRKDDHTTKLIFETEDPSNPGTITAYRAPATQSTAIGSVYRLIASNRYTGNVEFKSGNIIATGGTNAAGIGSSSGGGDVYNYVFSGANVTAKGLGHGAGIGGGMNGSVDNIKITGGTIVAYGESGAGIGGGKTTNSYDGRCGTITINGGNITATSKSASGIGSGVEGNIKRIIITGGTIRAVCEKLSGTGIGGTGSNFYGKCGRIDISGGTIYAQGGPDSGVGIGSALTGESGNTTINISGGYIEAIAGNHGVSVGGGGKGALQDKGHCYVNISGGTVICGPIFGARIGSRYSTTCTITGGSVRCSGVDCTVTDQPEGKGNVLTMMNINLMGCPVKTKVTEASFIDAGVEYGMKDVYTADGDAAYSVVYPWLPMESSTVEMTAGGVHYYGDVATSQGEGELYPSTKIVLDRNAGSTETSAMNGEAAGVSGELSARDITQAKRPGYTVKDYATDAAGTNIIMHTDGTFTADQAGYTDANGKWTMQAGSAVFYAVWESNGFSVKFDANKPKTASTIPEGSMGAQTFVYGVAQNLSANGFTLKGYTFTGWNTKADGTGTSLPGGADGSKLCQTKDGTITLYAQWKPITYTVKFDPNGGTGTMDNRTFTFDQPQALTKNTFTNGTKVFSGWQRDYSVGSRYSDGQTVKNLAHTQDAVVTMKALWSVPVDVNIRVTLDNEANTNCTISLMDSVGTTYSPAFTIAEGNYTYNGSGLPAGEYTVIINQRDTGRSITVPGGGSIDTFDYYTVEATPGNHITGCTVLPANAEASSVIFDDDIEGWPAGSIFMIKATGVEVGYTLSHWQSPGVDPDYIEGTTDQSNPAKISLKGKTGLLAEARPISYAVKFDANSAAVTGQMEEMVAAYGESQNLPPCSYGMEGYLFTGWNTMPDGKGVAYEDGAEFTNLATEEGAVVTLYAQWKPITYTVVFKANTGTGMMPAQQLTYDKSEKLRKNQFGNPGLHFSCWTCGDLLLMDEEEVLNLASTQGEKVYLYAMWSHDVYTVKYDPNGATGSAIEQTVLVNDPTSVSDCPFTRKGYTFVGWNTVPAGDGVMYHPGDTFTDLAAADETVTLYARWKKGSPRTGDSNLPFMWAGLALLAGGGIVLSSRRRKRER